MPAAFDLNDFAGETVRVRFILGTWGFTGSPGWYIDDLQVHGHSALCPWDLDKNGTVGMADLLAVLSAWGTDPGGPPDFNGNGNVGFEDLLELLANWGPCL